MSNDNSILIPTANELFTDREDPQEAFEWKLRLLSDETIRRNTSVVLSYYGIGGIGKTSFMNKLTKKNVS